jgi:hypothetical protein
MNQLRARIKQLDYIIYSFFENRGKQVDGDPI